MTGALPYDVLASSTLMEHRTLVKEVMSLEEWAVHSSKVCKALSVVSGMMPKVEKLDVVRVFVTRSISEELPDADISALLAGSADWMGL